MSTHDFSIDFSRFYNRPQGDLPDLRGPSALEKKEFARFFFIDSANLWLKEYQASGALRLKLLEVLSKVVLVVTLILAVLMPLAVHYLPEWVPWGIGLPSIIILLLVQPKLKEKIEVVNRNNQFVPLFKRFLQQHTLKSLHPTGEWDSPEFDARLKWDRPQIDARIKSQGETVRQTLHKIHPKSGKEIEWVVKDYDLEITPDVQYYVAEKFANMTHQEEKWLIVKNKLVESIGHFRNENLPKCEKAKAKAFSIAYEESLNPLDCPTPTTRDLIKSIVMLYHHFGQLFPELEKLLKEGEGLYAPYAFLDEGVRTCVKWPDFLNLAENIKADVEPLIELLEEENPTERTLFWALMYAQKRDLESRLFHLIDQTRRIKMEIQEWIEAHPDKQLETFTKRFAEIEENRLLTNGPLRKLLLKWVHDNPHSKEKCAELLTSPDFPKELTLWLQGYPQLFYESPSKLLDVLEGEKQEILKLLLKSKEPEVLNQKLMLLNQEIEILNQWILNHPRSCRKQCIELLTVKHFPNAIKARLKGYTQFLFITPSELLDRANKMTQKFYLAKLKFAQLQAAKRKMDACAIEHAEMQRAKMEQPLFVEKKEKTDLPQIDTEEIKEPGPEGLRDASSFKDFETYLPGAPNLPLKSRDCDLAYIHDPVKAYTEFRQAANTFKTKVIGPLNLFIEQSGEASKAKILFQAFLNNFRKVPPLPFVKETVPDHSPLSIKKMEEISLNKLLQKIDNRMVLTNRMRAVILRVSFIALNLIVVIVSSYISSSWFFWGCCGSSIIGAGVSCYIDYRLKQMDKKKQGIRLQPLLPDDIGVIPGNRASLQKLKAVQGKYGLEGVRATYARVLVEGEHILPAPNHIKSAKKIGEKICKKGSEQATKFLEKRKRFLEDTLIIRYSELRDVEAKFTKEDLLSLKKISEIERALRTENLSKEKEIALSLNLKILKLAAKLKKGKLSEKSKTLLFLKGIPSIKKAIEEKKLSQEIKDLLSLKIKIIELTEKVQNLKLVLIHVPKSKKYLPSPMSDYEKCIRARHRVDADLNRLASAGLSLEMKEKDYIEQSKKFERLDKEILLLQEAYAVWIPQLHLITLAMEGEHERGSDEKIEMLMEEIAYSWNMNKAGDTSLFDRLRALPINDLLHYKMDLEALLRRLPRAELALHRLKKDKHYQSKEGVDKKITAITKQRVEIKEKLTRLKAEYALKTEEIEKDLTILT